MKKPNLGDAKNLFNGLKDKIEESGIKEASQSVVGKVKEKIDESGVVEASQSVVGKVKDKVENLGILQDQKETFEVDKDSQNVDITPNEPAQMPNLGGVEITSENSSIKGEYKTAPQEVEKKITEKDVFKAEAEAIKARQKAVIAEKKAQKADDVLEKAEKKAEKQAAKAEKAKQKADQAAMRGNETKALKARQKVLDAEKKAFKANEAVKKAEKKADKVNSKASAMSENAEQKESVVGSTTSIAQQIKDECQQHRESRISYNSIRGSNAINKKKGGIGKWIAVAVAAVVLLGARIGIGSGGNNQSNEPPVNNVSDNIENRLEDTKEEVTEELAGIIEYDLSIIQDTELFENPDSGLIAEKLTIVDDVIRTLVGNGNIFIVSSNYIEDGVTDLDIVASGSKYGGVIETLESAEETSDNKYIVYNAGNNNELIYVANRLLFRFPADTKETFIDSVVKGIAANIEEINNADVVEVQKGEELPQNVKAEVVSSNEKVAQVSEINTSAKPIVSSTSEAPYGGAPYAVINNNIPAFTDEQKNNTSVFEIYSNLDSKGRCGVAFANICKETMPTGTRGAIGAVRPTGWHTIKYDNIEDRYLYNRCHLIAWQLAGENTNVKNLITGTRYLNVTGMLPFENKVADYVKSTQNHVLYRVSPKFDGDNLVATGVQIEAWSVEDEGKGICFNVFCYNIQPGIVIDYSTGDSHVGNAVASNTPDNNQATASNNNQNNNSSTSNNSTIAQNNSQTNKQPTNNATTSNNTTTNNSSSTSNNNTVVVPIIPNTENQNNNNNITTGGGNSNNSDSNGGGNSFNSAINPVTSVTPGTAYVLNTNPRSKKFHYPTCSSVRDMAEHNKKEFNGTREEAINMGYSPCQRCNP